MENLESTTDLLNDLIIINNDRAEGYESAAVEAKDLALTGLFEAMARDSRKFASELSLEVTLSGDEATTGTSTAGKIYRAWMDIKSKITKGDRVAILNSCEEGENVAIEAYEKALVSKTKISEELASKLVEQKKLIAEGLQTIIKLRDTVYSHA